MMQVKLTEGLWHDRQAVNARSAIFHQWEQLEASGCIENFRIAAGESGAFREGWFFSDSDAYKWLEAAARIYAKDPDPRLLTLVDDFTGLLERAQDPDGYLFTYNQIHFPGQRWQNLQIEHELYCHGHLIESGVSQLEATGNTRLLGIAQKAANRIVEDFMGRGPAFTPGHEEIEIALLRLHQSAPDGTRYLDLARQFVEQRGRWGGQFGLDLLRQNARVSHRSRLVLKQKQSYKIEHSGYQPFRLPPGNKAAKPRGSTLRWYVSALSGKFFQQHLPVRSQLTPVGHSVRFGYLETAAAMLCRLDGDDTLRPPLEKAWEHMVTRRMYVTGGTGSVPGLEGFGRDYELDPEYAYAETCAALADVFWNREMGRLTGDAKYAELLEWQLYNAAAVGMSLDGKTYLYNNPLACRSTITRQAWYAVPCCPSNLSRTFADLENYISSAQTDRLQVNQYISCQASQLCIPLAGGRQAVVSMEMTSGLPWYGSVRIVFNEVRVMESRAQEEFELQLRCPSWASKIRAAVNGQATSLVGPERPEPGDRTACGYDPRLAVNRSIQRAWAAGDQLDLELEMPFCLRRAHPKVKGHTGKAALSRGPLVYCLESCDNPGLDIFSVEVDSNSIETEYDPGLLGGVMKLNAKTTCGEPLVFIPYFLWANRGLSQMTVWVNVGDGRNHAN